MRRALVLVLLLLGTTAQAAPVLAFADGNRVCVAAVDHLDAKTCTELPGAVVALAWQSSAALVVLVEGGGERAGLVADGRFTPFTIPPAKTWRAPKPQRDGVPLGPGSQSRLVITPSNEVWLGRCAWVALVDAPECQAWVYARLDGKAEARHEAPAERGDPYGPGDAPKGVHVTVAPAGDPGTAPTVHCERGDARSTFKPPAREGAAASAEVVWPAGSEGAYLVSVDYDFMEVVQHQLFLFEACIAASQEDLDEQDSPIWGPGGVFVHHGDHAWIVRAGKRVLATLPASDAAPAFR